MSFVSESHTAENLHGCIEDALQEWNLTNEYRPIFIVSDNAPNMVKAIGLNENWERIPCFAHTLQLAIKDALKDTVGFGNIRKKCRSLVGFFSRSSTAHAKLDEMQVSINPNATPLKLIQDVETRWNSEFDMMKRLLELRTALGAVLSFPNMPKSISNDEWDIIEMYTEALGPFKEATVLMSGEKYPTLSSYIPIVKGLKKATEDFVNENAGKKCSNLGKKLLSAVKARFTDICENEAFLLAMVADPRYKNRFLKGEEKLKAENALVNRIERIQPQEDAAAKRESLAPNKSSKGSLIMRCG